MKPSWLISVRGQSTAAPFTDDLQHVIDIDKAVAIDVSKAFAFIWNAVSIDIGDEIQGDFTGVRSVVFIAVDLAVAATPGTTKVLDTLFVRDVLLTSAIDGATRARCRNVGSE